MAEDTTERHEMGAAPDPEGADHEPAPDEAAAKEAKESMEPDLPLTDQWVFLIDPAWQRTEESDEPPPEAVVGGWYADSNGEQGRFRPNAAYEPSEPGLPTDPVDAALQLVVSGKADGDELLQATREVILGVAVDDEGYAVVAPAPDDVPSALVATAPRHRERVNAPGWVEVTVEDLAAGLPNEGVDVLLNPGAPASMRLIAGGLKDFLARGDTTAGTQAVENPGDVSQDSQEPGDASAADEDLGKPTETVTEGAAGAVGEAGKGIAG